MFVKARRGLEFHDFLRVASHLITWPYQPFVHTPTFEFLVPWEYYTPDVRGFTTQLRRVRIVPAPSNLVAERRYEDGVPLPRNPLKAYLYARSVEPGPSWEIAVLVLSRQSNFANEDHSAVWALKTLVAAVLGQDWRRLLVKVGRYDPPLTLRYALLHRPAPKYGRVIRQLSARGLVVLFDHRILETYVSKICFGVECRVE